MSDEVLVSKKDLVSIIDALNRFTDDQNSVLLNDSVTVSKQDLVGIIDTLKLYAVDQSSLFQVLLLLSLSLQRFCCTSPCKRDYLFCVPHANSNRGLNQYWSLGQRCIYLIQQRNFRQKNR